MHLGSRASIVKGYIMLVEFSTSGDGSIELNGGFGPEAVDGIHILGYNGGRRILR